MEVGTKEEVGRSVVALWGMKLAIPSAKKAENRVRETIGKRRGEATILLWALKYVAVAMALDHVEAV